MGQVKSRRDRTEKVAQTLKKEKTEPNQNVEVGFPIKFVVSLSFKDLSVCKKICIEEKSRRRIFGPRCEYPESHSMVKFHLRS